VALSGYPVPARQTRVELRFGNSRFIGTVDDAATVARARRFIESIRARYPDASHHVYAFAVGHGASVTHGMGDDGEPAGTAGRPTLAVVQGADLGDVVLVTTRYFGGTKLGTGGLVRAYTATAQQALAAVPRARRVALCRFDARVGYEHYALCRRLLEEGGASIQTESFGREVALGGTCPADQAKRLDAAVGQATSGQGRLTVSPA
jgi:uncharacterized YigZ family protein